MKKCPFCAEEIQDAAIKCRYCGSELEAKIPKQSGIVDSSQNQGVLNFPEDEKTYYSDGAITITSTRAILGSKIYAMANVTLVSLGEHQGGLGGGCFLLILGLFLSLFLFSSETMIFGLIGIGLFALGIWLMAQKSFVVKIGSASGESNALMNKDRTYIEKIVSAMSQAIVDRR